MSGTNDVQPRSLIDQHADLCARHGVPFVLKHDAEAQIDTAYYGPVALPLSMQQGEFFAAILTQAQDRDTPFAVMETTERVEVALFFRAAPPAPDPTTRAAETR